MDNKERQDSEGGRGPGYRMNGRGKGKEKGSGETGNIKSFECARINKG